MALYRTEGRKLLEGKVNDALVELFINCGIAPRIIGSEEFKHFCNTLNGNYSLTSRTKFEDSLVPAYAANVRLAVLDYLQTCRYLTISSDGAKLKRKKFITVHITTVYRQSFCVDLDDVSRISQTGEYFAELFKKWIQKIGPYRFCAATSDRAGNINRGRFLSVEDFPWMFNLSDACHNLHHVCKDICNIPVFQPIVAEIKEILALMSLSTYTLDWFDAARKELWISRGLQSVGETRFGTIYWSLDSIERGIPAFTSIVRNPALGIESECATE
ncbi:hypothetical protein B0H14DRAFT_2643410 [Mycena olivaceomarginata]|nr:hypothetical protein B0H14DRAFT_2643410 [Mycena olivaceomarginata]